MPNPEREAATAINRSWPVLQRYFDTPRWHQTSTTDPAAIIRDMPWAQWTQEVGAVIDPLQRATEEAFQTEVGNIKGKLTFDVIDNVSTRYAAQQGSKLIQSITETQRETVRTLVTESLQGDWTVDQLGRKLRDTVGLHPAWAQAVVRFEERQYAALIKDGKTPEQAAATAARRAEVKRKHLLKRRGENIARTEIQTASNLGKYASWDAAIAQGFASKQSRKEFSPGPGACEICAPISGEVVAWDAPFSNGKTMPPFHPSCRCTANILPPDYNNEDLDPTAFDWLDDSDVVGRAEYQPTLADRIGNLANRPAPYIPPAAAPLAPPPVTVWEEPPAPAGTAADTLTLQSTAHLSDDELNDLIVKYADSDPEAMDKVLDIIDQREAANAAAAAWHAAEDAREAAAAASANDWGTIPEEFLAPPAGTLSKLSSRALTADEQVAEDYNAYVQTQYSRALDDINGVFLNEAGKRAGIASEDLFSGNVQMARKYASDELIAWWEENGRHTKGSFRYTVLRRDADRPYLDTVKAQGFQGYARTGSYGDRSTF